MNTSGTKPNRTSRSDSSRRRARCAGRCPRRGTREPRRRRRRRSRRQDPELRGNASRVRRVSLVIVRREAAGTIATVAGQRPSVETLRHAARRRTCGTGRRGRARGGPSDRREPDRVRSERAPGLVTVEGRPPDGAAAAPDIHWATLPTEPREPMRSTRTVSGGAPGRRLLGRASLRVASEPRRTRLRLAHSRRSNRPPARRATIGAIIRQTSRPAGDELARC